MATAIPDDFIQVGYQNGLIPSCALQPVVSLPNIRLHPQAAEQLGKLLIAAKAANLSFSVGSSFRTYDQQASTRAARGIGAAVPGSSLHGWGTAIDISELYRLAERSINTQAGETILSPSVHARIRSSDPLYKWLAVNGPKYGWVNPSWARNNQIPDECWHWEYQAWPSLPNTVPAENRPITPRITARCGQDTVTQTRYALSPTGQIAPTSSITPFLGSLESFHPGIQYELTRRRVSAETANVYMPFVKLTSLVHILPENLVDGGDAWCPSLGPHGENNISFDDIYLPQDNRSIVGYAIANNNSGTEAFSSKRVPVVVDRTAATTTDQRNIPMPGITEINAERSTAGPMGVRGGLLKADIKLVAYSIGQVDTLLKYYLRPATRVVLELGRKSSNPSETITPYAWNMSAPELAQEFTTLINNPSKQREFIRDYVYNNNGNYEIFIAYVVKFDLKYNKNNVYEISLTVHSVQQFELPTVHTGVKSLCSDSLNKCKAVDVHEYFDDAYSWKPNTFKQLMSEETTISSPNNQTQQRTLGWGDHFVAISNPTPSDMGAGSKEAGTDQNEFFVSWNFFVDKILNDARRGVISVIPDDSEVPTNTDEAQTTLSTQEMLRLGLLRPVSQPTETELSTAKTQLVANEVGYHPNLRSTDANVMIIYNPVAQANRSEQEKEDFQNILVEGATLPTGTRATFNSNTRIVEWISKSSVSDFRNSKRDNGAQAGSGFLSNGVWLNTKAIKQAFSNADTVTAAISSLLGMMNAASQGYWNLQLYSTDRTHSGLFVVDMGLSKRLENTTAASTEASAVFPWIDQDAKKGTVLKSINDINIDRYRKSNDAAGMDRSKYIYMFNRGTERVQDGELGSDIIDLNVEFNLPQVIAVQAIAGVGGPAQKSTLNAINVSELNRISLIKKLFTVCKDDNFCTDADCNDNQREITSLKARYDALNTQLKLINAGPITSGSVPDQTRDKLEQDVNAAREDYIRAEAQRTFGNGMVVDTIRELSSLGTLLEHIEFNPAAMLRKLNLDSTNAEDRPARPVPEAHSFNSSNLTKTMVSLTMPGIGGIELFQSFLVDRVPSLLLKGFYVVTKVTHKFSSSNGWTTVVEGRFRYRPTAEDGTTTTEYKKPCEPNPQATGAAAATPPTTQPAASTTQSRPTANPTPGSTSTTAYEQSLRQRSDYFLRTTFLTLEQKVQRPRLASIATREAWEARVSSGEVNRDRRLFEQIKAEIRRRLQVADAAGDSIPREFRPLRGFGPPFNTAFSRLEPVEWSQGTGTF